jgi:hypothetical protein
MGHNYAVLASSIIRCGGEFDLFGMRIMMSTSTASMLAATRVVGTLAFVLETVAAAVCLECTRTKECVNIELIIVAAGRRKESSTRVTFQRLGRHGVSRRGGLQAIATFTFR